MGEANLRSKIFDAMLPQVVMEPLRSKIASGGEPERTYHVIIEVNTAFERGIAGARELIRSAIVQRLGVRAVTALRRNHVENPQHPFLFAELTRDDILAVVMFDGGVARDIDAYRSGIANDTTLHEPPVPTAHRHLRAIWKVWESTEMAPLTSVSVRTVKSDAALTAFGAAGEGIVWAVLDSGIDVHHPHFARYKSTSLDLPLAPKSFAFDKSNPTRVFDPLADEFGHGTHVAGIIAGAAALDGTSPPRAAVQSVGAGGSVTEYHFNDVPGIRGMAPQCKLLSLRVLDHLGGGDDTSAMNALEYVMQLNGYGANMLVHGVNLSTGYLPDAQTYGIGGSPLCRLVDRAVNSGLVVVVAAGNYGYVLTQALGEAGALQNVPAGQLSSIADPGNAELAITVGSTHRESPHTHGVSYFSSRGPTVDGRSKPDVVAPGERIISCATGITKKDATARLPADLQGGPAGTFDYAEDTGTSMAAPHVAGIIAAFLSIRREFIGQPLKVRDVLVNSAIDLRRDQRMQGAGLVDLFRMLQAI